MIASVLSLLVIPMSAPAQEATAAPEISVTPETPAAPADPESPPAQVAEPPEAAEAAAPPPAPGPTAITEVVKVTRPELKPPRGYDVVVKGDQVLWCAETQALGSRVRKNDRECVTPEMYQEMVWTHRRVLDDAGRTTIPPR
jgi:hypothetical protein